VSRRCYSSLFDKLTGRDKDKGGEDGGSEVPEGSEALKVNDGSHVQIIKPQDFAQCNLRQAPIGPRKMKKFCDMVRGMSVEEALLQCRMSIKKSAKIVEKALLSVRANAVHNHGLDVKKLYLHEIYATKGRYRKKLDMKAKGKGVIKKKYFSHLTVIVKEGQAMRKKIKLIPGTLERRARRMAKTTQASNN